MLLQHNPADPMNSMNAFLCQEFSGKVDFSDGNNFSLYAYSEFCHSPIVKHLFVSHLFFSFLNSTAVKTLKCLSDIFSREIFIYEVVRFRKYECFQGFGSSALKRAILKCSQNHVLGG